MKIFKNWFLIKRPKPSVLSKSKDYENGKLAEIKEFYIDKKACAKYGFEDGYVIYFYVGPTAILLWKAG